MDRSTKERLIGAIVLVAVAWLVIPVFLDGPEGPQEYVRQSVDLPGQEGQPMRTKTIVLNPPADADGSGPARVTDPAPASRKLPAPRPQRTAPSAGTEKAAAEPASRQEPKPAPVTAESRPSADAATRGGTASEPPTQASAGNTDRAAGRGLWAVQLGSFSSQENAERLASDLRKQGFAAFLSRVQDGDRRLHRVRVGPQGSRDEAADVAAKLAAAGHRGQVVSHP
jgi:DedD protein